MKTKTSDFKKIPWKKISLGMSFLTFLGSGLFPIFGQNLTPTPESCFEFSNGTITNYLVGNPGCGKDVVIPSRINGQKVIALGGRRELQSTTASFSNKGLSSIEIPDTVTEIKDNALRYNNLTSLKLSPNLKVIEHAAFAQNRLTELEIPRSVTSLGSYVLNGNNFPKEKAVIYGRNPDGSDNFSKIESYASIDIDENYTIPNGVKEIDTRAYANLGLKTVIFPEGLEKINDAAFYKNQLKSVIFPESLTTIGKNAFTKNSTTPVIGHKKGGITGMTINPKSNIIINPLKLIIHHKDLQGQSLIKDDIFYGPSKTDLTARTPATANEYFQPGTSIMIKPLKIQNYTSPKPQEVTFPINPNSSNNSVEISFIYEKITPELILHYTFDDTSNLGKDSSGKGNDGTVAGGIESEDWGRVGGAINFNGNKNSYIQFKHTNELEPDSITVAAWVKPEKKSPNSRQMILTKRDGYSLELQGNGTTPVFKITNIINGTTTAGPTIRSQMTIENDKWAFIVGTFDEASKMLKIYVNGILQGEVQLLSGIAYNGIDGKVGDVGYENPSFKGNIDDLRIYNYALTSDAIKSLYESYPPEDSSVAAEISLDAEQLSGIFVETNKTLYITSKFFRPTKDTTLEVIIPDSLRVKEHSIIPNDNGTMPVSGTAVVTKQGTDTIYRMQFVDDSVGQISTPFLVYFPKHVTADGKKATIKAVLKKGGKIISEKEITLEAYNKSQITLHSITTQPYLLANDLDITYQLITQTNYQAPGSKTWGWSDPKSAMFFGTWATIPLPEKAIFVNGGDSTVKYDATSHSVKINYGNYRGRQNRKYFTIRYHDVRPGEKVQGGDIIFTGIEGNTVPREFIYSGINNIISDTTLKLGITIYHSLNNVGAGLYLPGTKNVDFYHLGIRNTGNTPVENMEMTRKLPEALHGRNIRVPSSSKVNIAKWTGKVTITYSTNKGRTLSKSFTAPHNNEMLDALKLGLQSDEYITILKIKWNKFNPGDFSIPSYGGATQPSYSFAVAGDVAEKYNDGSIIKGGDPAKMQWSVTENGKELYSGVASTIFASKTYTPITSETKILGNKLIYNQGEKTSITLKAYRSSYPYANGTYLKDPTLYFMIPKGFTVPLDSIKILNPQYFSIQKIEKITPKITPPQEAVVYRVRLKGEIGKGKNGLNLSADLNISKDALPKEYDFREFISLGSEDPKSQVYYGRGSRYRKDKYGIIGNPNEFELVGPGVSDNFAQYHTYRNITVASSVFGLSKCFKTKTSEEICRGTFEEENPLSRSSFKSGEKGTYQVEAYNNSSKEVTDFSYVIRFPRKGNMTYGSNVNERTAILYGKPKIENASGSIIQYSLDGKNYSENYGTDISKVQSLKITIPSIKRGENPKITVGLQAPEFMDTEANRLAFLKTSYTIADAAGTFDGGTLGLRLVKSDFTEDLKYAFCNTLSVIKTNPGISVDECKALIDLYSETQGIQRKFAQGWHNATQTVYKNYIQNICTRDGITCENTKLTKIQLPGNRLKGILPNSFKDLKNLRTIDLSNNDLGTSLSKIDNPNLTELKVGNSQLTESIPSTFFTKNPSLEIVDLSHNKLKGSIPQLGNKIKHLILSENKLTGMLPHSLAQLNNLEILKLEDNLLVGPLPQNSKEAKFSKLREFTIHNNYIKDVAEKHSQTYLGLLSNNSIIKSNVKNNSKQYKLLLVDKLGNTKKENHNAGESVTVNAKRQQFNGNKFIDIPQVPLTTKNDGINIQSQNFPSYTIKLAPGKTEGIFQVSVAGAEGGNDERIHAKFRLSSGTIENLDEQKPGKWEVNPLEKNESEELGKGLHFELGGKYLDEYFSVVHFNVAGNDFGGGFFWLPVEKLATPIIIETKIGNETERKVCQNKVRGFYYNSQRGERLWPLDVQSQDALKKFSPSTYGSLAIGGGRYTSCQGTSENGKNKEDPYGIYGSITHTYNGQTFHLNAGIAYDTMYNKMKSDGLRCNFQRLNNSYPFGYIYDDHGHIGFVGAKIKEEQIKTENVEKFHSGLNARIDEGICINEIFDYNGKEIGYTQDPNKKIEGFDNRDAIKGLLTTALGSAKTTLFNLGIKGIVGLTSEINTKEKEFVENNSLDSALLLRTDANISKIVNVANRNAEYLCRGKRQTELKLEQKLICINENTNMLNALTPSKLAGKTIIVRNRDLELQGYQTSENAPINLFIDKGNLILTETESNTGDLAKFDSFGYLEKDQDCKTCSSANYLKGNFIINGLLLAGDDGEGSLKNKLYIHGKLVSLNTFGKPTDQKTETVKTILGNRFKNHIALDELFVWNCDAVEGIGSDGTRCKGESKKGGKQSSLLVDKAFGLIDMDFSSLLFR